MSLDMQVKWLVPGKVIMETLLDPIEMMKVTRAKATRNNSSIRWLDGFIEIENLKEDKDNLKIEMDFRFKDWQSFSQVTITFKDDDSDNCSLYLVQNKIPSNVNVDKQIEGWNHQIFRPMSLILGYAMQSQ